ncbi:hypothetical protein NG800_006985 [Epilithonimonas ginsengisoli]|uniref:Uncharacterized protein n=1 Tax=Epilithonimonas ginsengisoli TaxID=1245592 RepID=A0ABU4JG56_9FLAO|nr:MULTISPECIES: hypothetical protein [Chryseobacterium group]MBV6879998.1 hypothetical protein [Epilithonimonas sp. FP105]MDW8548648.1 hypothetical protein [Epilithonimonas ginsengisoli]OAH75092.1 hypothetical protein AXA65_05295 [Chryseobacterium sp. FP211-J200]
MKIVEHFEIETTKELAESLAELRKITNKNYFSFFGFNEKIMFRGIITNRTFKITKITNVRGVLEAVSTGNISEKDGKFIVKVSIRPAIFSVVYSLTMAVFVMFLVIFLNVIGLLNITMNIVFLFFVLAFTMIPVFSYDEEKERSKKKLIEIFK